jgi:hypothetical protein
LSERYIQHHPLRCHSHHNHFKVRKIFAGPCLTRFQCSGPSDPPSRSPDSEKYHSALATLVKFSSASPFFSLSPARPPSLFRLPATVSAASPVRPRCAMDGDGCPPKALSPKLFDTPPCAHCVFADRGVVSLYATVEQSRHPIHSIVASVNPAATVGVGALTHTPCILTLALSSSPPSLLCVCQPYYYCKYIIRA